MRRRGISCFIRIGCGICRRIEGVGVNACRGLRGGVPVGSLGCGGSERVGACVRSPACACGASWGLACAVRGCVSGWWV
jgi:hypothetical protein